MNVLSAGRPGPILRELTDYILIEIRMHVIVGRQVHSLHDHPQPRRAYPQIPLSVVALETEQHDF